MNLHRNYSKLSGKKIKTKISIIYWLNNIFNYFLIKLIIAKLD